MRSSFIAVALAALLACGACASATRHADRIAKRSTATTVPDTSTTTTTKPPPYPPGPLAPVVFRVKTQQKVVFITIDDGVVRDPRVLALEKRMRLPLTLFLIRRTANDGKPYWKQMQTAGATIEDHTITHTTLRGRTYADQHHEICDVLPEFTSWFGKRPTLFRPPYGEFDEATRRTVNECGLRAAIHWTATMTDGKLSFQDGEIAPGDIILLHFKSDLYDELVKLVDYIHAHGYRIGRLESSLSAADLAPSTPPGTSKPPIKGD